MEKLWTAMRVRMPESMAAEIRSLAEQEHRPFLHEVRHLISIGLEQKRLGGVHGTPVTFGSAKPPQRAYAIPQGYKKAQGGTA